MGTVCSSASGVGRSLNEGIVFAAWQGDLASHVDWLHAELDKRGACAVIPPKSDRKIRIDCDREM